MLINTHDLANLARISLTDAEHIQYGRDIESILAFIDTIQSLSVESNTTTHSEGMPPVGVVRIDEAHVREGEFVASEIVAQAPENGSGFVKVKKILNQ